MRDSSFTILVLLVNVGVQDSSFTILVLLVTVLGCNILIFSVLVLLVIVLRCVTPFLSLIFGGPRF